MGSQQTGVPVGERRHEALPEMRSTARAVVACHPFLGWLGSSASKMSGTSTAPVANLGGTKLASLRVCTRWKRQTRSVTCCSDWKHEHNVCHPCRWAVTKVQDEQQYGLVGMCYATRCGRGTIKVCAYPVGVLLSVVGRKRDFKWISCHGRQRSWFGGGLRECRSG